MRDEGGRQIFLGPCGGDCALWACWESSHTRGGLGLGRSFESCTHQKACVQMARVNAKDTKPIIVAAREIGASCGMVFVGHEKHGHLCGIAGEELCVGRRGSK